MNKREVIAVLPGKIVIGEITPDFSEQRTFDYFVNPVKQINLRESDSNRFILKDFVPLTNATVFFRGSSGYREAQKYPALNIRKQSIIFFFDKAQSMGKDLERLKHEKMVHPPKLIYIVTKSFNGIFYIIHGIFSGLPGEFATNSFVALSQVEIKEFTPLSEQPANEKRPFIGFNPDKIESYIAVDIKREEK